MQDLRARLSSRAAGSPVSNPVLTRQSVFTQLSRLCADRILCSLSFRLRTQTTIKHPRRPVSYVLWTRAERRSTFYPSDLQPSDWLKSPPAQSRQQGAQTTCAISPADPRNYARPAGEIAPNPTAGAVGLREGARCVENRISREGGTYPRILTWMDAWAEARRCTYRAARGARKRGSAGEIAQVVCAPCWRDCA